MYHDYVSKKHLRVNYCCSWRLQDNGLVKLETGKPNSLMVWKPFTFCNIVVVWLNSVVKWGYLQIIAQPATIEAIRNEAKNKKSLKPGTGWMCRKRRRSSKREEEPKEELHWGRKRTGSEDYDGLWEVYIVNVGDWNILLTHLFFMCLKYYNGHVSK